MAKFAARDFTPTGSLGNMLKDLDSIQAFALKTKTPMPLDQCRMPIFIAFSSPWGWVRRTAPRPCACSTDSEIAVDSQVNEGHDVIDNIAEGLAKVSAYGRNG
jgi:hypothetical protein